MRNDLQTPHTDTHMTRRGLLAIFAALMPQTVSTTGRLGFQNFQATEFRISITLPLIITVNGDTFTYTPAELANILRGDA